MDRQVFVEEYVGRLAASCIKVTVVSVVDAVPEDPPDNEVFACALDGAARYLVTGNERHLGKLGTWEGVKIVAASRFLEEAKTSA